MSTPFGMRASSRHGQALVEFALVFPVLVIIVLAMFDLGRGIFMYGTISNAAREGGRTAIVNQNVSDIAARAEAQATSLDFSGASGCSGGTPSGPSGVCATFTLADMTTPCSPTAPGCVATIVVKATFTPITPLIGNLVGPIAMTSKTEQVIESACIGAGCPIPRTTAARPDRLWSSSWGGSSRFSPRLPLSSTEATHSRNSA
jgi:Flp pilus assembly protein TadG